MQDFLRLLGHVIHALNAGQGVPRRRWKSVQENEPDQWAVLMVRAQASQVVQELHGVSVPHGAHLPEFSQHVKRVPLEMSQQISFAASICICRRCKENPLHLSNCF